MPCVLTELAHGPERLAALQAQHEVMQAQCAAQAVPPCSAPCPPRPLRTLYRGTHNSEGSDHLASRSCMLAGELPSVQGW